jgi:hypothetical protein
MTNFKRKTCIKRKGHKFLFCQTQKTTSIRFIRYVDNFVIIINDERFEEQYFEEAKTLLVEHDLQLSLKKTCIFLWKIGKKIHFINFFFIKLIGLTSIPKLRPSGRQEKGSLAKTSMSILILMR